MNATTEDVDKGKSRPEWADPGDKGRFVNIDTENLRIDSRYQRQLELNKVQLISTNFNWVSFGHLTVMERANGDLYITDGQHRWEAAKRRGFKKVPCAVWSSPGLRAEAKSFVECNTGRKPVAAVAKFKAAVVAGMQPQKAIHDWAASIGMVVGATRRTPNNIRFVSNLQMTWERDTEATKKAIEFQRKLVEGGEMHDKVHFGLYTLFHMGINVFEYFDKIQKLGGNSAILGRIKEVQIETGRGSANLKTCGLGLLSCINHKLRRKIKWVDEETSGKRDTGGRFATPQWEYEDKGAA